jgi:6-phosphofructo-2-kinase/fructose-2,6-biphosphatase 2
LDRLRTLDDATKVLRQSTKAPTRAPSVSGIGAVIEKPDYSEAKIVVAMVGLPARGKSYLSNRLMRYLRVSYPDHISAEGTDILVA